MLSYHRAVPPDCKLATKWCHSLALDQREESDSWGSLTLYMHRNVDTVMSGWERAAVVDIVYHAGVDEWSS